jgi:hypothetical protein
MFGYIDKTNVNKKIVYIFVGPIEDTLEDTDSDNTYLCEQKEKPGGEKFNVNVSM